MILSSKATPRRRTHVAAGRAGRPGRRVAAWIGILVVGLFSACGGGTEQFDPFEPKRLLVFGDETSALTATGRHYGVNGLDANGQFDCTLQPNWVQSLAAVYGFGYVECNPNTAFEPAARNLAFAGARVDDLAAQVEQQVAAGGFRDKDLATVLAGTNDLIEIYGGFPGLSEDLLLAEARARGRRLAQVVNRLVALGVKVIVSDLPDLGLTPYARAQDTLTGGSGRAALLSRLTTAFNEQLGVSVLLDGRFVGLVQAQLRFQAVERAPGAFGLGNISDALCTVALPDCTTATLVENGTPGSYLWADELRLSPAGQAQLASLVVDRARRNPF